MEKRPGWAWPIALVLAFRYGYRLRYLSIRTMRPLAADK